jgi:hypothetical protein
LDLLYSGLHRRVKSDGGGEGKLVLPAPHMTAAEGIGARDPLADALLERIRKIQANGARVILVMLPDQGREREREYRIARQVSAGAGIPLLDLKPALDHELAYTDSVHLTAGSGSRLAAALGSWVRTENQP